MTKLILPSEKVALVAAIDPDANGAATYTTDAVDATNFQQFLTLVSVGEIASSGTVDFKLRQATSSTGAGIKDITDRAIAQLTTGDNDKQALINLKATELDVSGGFKWIIGSMTVATAAADSAAYIFGLEPNRGPANDHDLSSVGEIV